MVARPTTVVLLLVVGLSLPLTSCASFDWRAMHALGRASPECDAGDGVFAAPKDLNLGGPSFMENLGQVPDGGTRFISTIGGASFGLMNDRLIIAIARTRPQPARPSNSLETQPSLSRGAGCTTANAIVIMRFEGCRVVEPIGVGDTGSRSNFLIGDDPRGWVSGARSFNEVLYEGLWPGIDMRFRFHEGGLKYDLLLGPGTDASLIAFRYEGIDGMRLDPATGDLMVGTAAGILRDSMPIVLQDGLPHTGVPAGFTLKGGDMVGFTIPDACVRSLPLVIDPGLVFSTFICGSDDDEPRALARDGEGNILITGRTESTDFETTSGAFCSTAENGFVAKLDPMGSTLLFATYFGGRVPVSIWQTIGESLTVRPDGKIVVTGTTGSKDFPTSADAYCQTLKGYTDAFVLVLDPTGSSLVYGSYFGGSGNETDTYHGFDESGRLVLCGGTSSLDLPVTPGAFCATHDGPVGTDVFLARFGPTWGSVSACTYIGGNGTDVPGQFYIDSSGALILVGCTSSPDLPVTPGAFCTTIEWGHSNHRGFALKLRPDWTSMYYCTYLAGRLEDHCVGVHGLPNGTALVLGYTVSSDFPTTPNAPKRTLGEWDGFVTVLSMDGSSLEYSTFWGGDHEEKVDSVAWEDNGASAVIAGTIYPSGLPVTVGCYDPEYEGGYRDAFVAVINLTTLRTTYCTYIGGSMPQDTSGEVVSATAIHGNDLYATGYTTSSDFPTTQGAYQRTSLEGLNGFILLLDTRPVGLPQPPTGLEATPGDGFLTLNWSANPFIGGVVVHYRVYRGESPGTESFLIETPRAPTYIDDGLVNGKPYYYRVSAINSAGEGPLSEELAAHAVGPPTAPLNLTCRSGNGTVVLEWLPPATDGGTAIMDYEVLRGMTTGNLVHYATVGNVTSFVDEAVVLGEFYYYKVAAITSFGKGVASSSVRIRALDVPGSPLDLCLSPGNGSVTLSWQLPSRTGGGMLLGFRIYRGESPLTMAFLVTKGPMELSYTDTGLTNGKIYYYQVSAFSESGEGPPTAVLDAAPLKAPGAPLNLRASAGDKMVTLEWDAPTDNGGRPILHYKIFKGTGSAALDLLATIGNVTRFNSTGLSNGAVYYYQILAENEAGDGSRTLEVEARPVGLPGVATSLIGQATDEGVELTWAEPSDLGGAVGAQYDLLRGSAPDRLEPLLQGLPYTRYVDAQVVTGQTYYYAVRAVTSVGAGPLTQPVEVKALAAPASVSSLRALAGDGRIVLEWGPPANDGGTPITGYIVLRGLLETGLMEVASPGPVLKCIDAGVVNGKRYFYSVIAVNAFGRGPMSIVVNSTPLGKPLAPTLFKATVKGGSVVLNWTVPVGSDRVAPTGYKVLRGTSPTALEVIAEVGTAAGFTDTTVKKGTKYYYSVVAKSEMGDGTAAQIIEVETMKESSRTPAFSLVLAIGAVAIAALISGLLMGTKGRRI